MSCVNLQRLEISWPGQLSLPVQALVKAPRLEVVRICNLGSRYRGSFDVLPEENPSSRLNLDEAEGAVEILSGAGFEFGSSRIYGLQRVTRILRTNSYVSADQSFSLAPPRDDPAQLV